MAHTPKRERPFLVERRKRREAERKVGFYNLIKGEGGLGLPSFYFTVSKTHNSPWVQYLVKSGEDICYSNLKAFEQQGWIESRRRWQNGSGALMNTYGVTDIGWSIIEEVEP